MASSLVHIVVQNSSLVTKASPLLALACRPLCTAVAAAAAERVGERAGERVGDYLATLFRSKTSTTAPATALEQSSGATLTIRRHTFSASEVAPTYASSSAQIAHQAWQDPFPFTTKSQLSRLVQTSQDQYNSRGYKDSAECLKMLECRKVQVLRNMLEEARHNTPTECCDLPGQTRPI
jgi:hypothetical protein